jgi:hypothetical protein
MQKKAKKNWLPTASPNNIVCFDKSLNNNELHKQQWLVKELKRKNLKLKLQFNSSYFVHNHF